MLYHYNMRIDRLELKNFRCFAERTFEFHPEMNLIVGENGSGKSALLEALEIASRGCFMGFSNLNLLIPKILNDQRRRIPAMPDPNRSNKRRPTISWNTAQETLVQVSSTIDNISVTWQLQLAGSSAQNDLAKVFQLNADRGRRMESGEITKLPIGVVFSTERTISSTQNALAPDHSLSIVRDPSRASRLYGYGDQASKNRIDSLAAWFLIQDWREYSEDDSDGSVLRIVRSAIVDCIEGAERLHFDKRSVELVLEMKWGAIESFNNLSGGQKMMLEMVGEIARVAATANPHLGDEVLQQIEGVVLIDELDLQLHPKWQRRIIENLRRTFPKIQFFASTHSPFLVQSLRSGSELVVLDQDEVGPGTLGNESLESIAQGIMGVEHPEVSKLYMDKKEAAREYLEEVQRLRGQGGADEMERARLAETISEYSDDPAYQAFLELESTTLPNK
jgi:predicted ATP-binding protein involved in virulence